MDLKALDATSAYAKAVGSAVNGDAPIGGKSAVGGDESFGDLLKGMVDNVSTATNASEKTALQAVNGSADIVDVVSDVSNAEMVVNTVVAVRDKVIQAYQDIMRMPI